MRTGKTENLLAIGTVAVLGLLYLPGSVALAEQDIQLTDKLKHKRPLDGPVVVNKDTADFECLDCHGVKGYAVPTGEFGDSPKRKLYIDPDTLKYSVHHKESCVKCHTTIEQIPHKTDKPHPVDCVHCHEGLATGIDEVKTQVELTQTMVGLPPKMPEQSKLLKETKHYLASIHAKPQKDNPRQPNASCWDCHGKHNVFPMDGKDAAIYRLSSPETCGRCHQKALKAYTNSVHGAPVKRSGKMDPAVCSDCHTAHKVASPDQDPVKVAITENCGSCHDEEANSYRSTYHGQVARLGYAHTAKCHDCHNPHNTQKSDHPEAKTHVNNRLKACKECHKQATASFIKFQPHGNTHDFKRYPAMWITAKLMILLLASVFLFFWAHSVLWFRRELKDHRAASGKQPAMRVDENGQPLAQAEGKTEVRRFAKSWRIAHLVLAIAVMTLAITGTTVMFADSFWAPVLIKLLGGPVVAAIIHRIAAVIFAVIFFGHLIAIARNIFGRKERFQWFGPDSLMPNRQDLRDIVAMVKWFFEKGPRPAFDRWTYWEKFDYWAPFWGLTVIGLSGLMLWFPTAFGSVLPGWVFNVATIVHGEEAFLAIVFLFTVHYFNSHFRPEKYPVDVVMFTGSVPLEEFKQERPLEYQRLMESGELEHYLVEPPTEQAQQRSRRLGFVLIGIGLGLLLLVLLGFLQGLVS